MFRWVLLQLLHWLDHGWVVQFSLTGVREDFGWISLVLLTSLRILAVVALSFASLGLGWTMLVEMNISLSS
jgi:hypothetical protein